MIRIVIITALLAGCARPVLVEPTPPRVISPPASIMQCPPEPALAVSIDMATEQDAWIYASDIRSWGRICAARMAAAKVFIEKEIEAAKKSAE